MPSRVRRRALLRWCSSAILAILPLGATDALAQTRCEGTLCDLYYDHLAGPQQKQPTAAARQQATPATAQQAQPGDSLLGRLFGASPPQPTTGTAPVKRPLVAVQGGGLVGMVQGSAPKRCTGTLCDLYYGGPPPEQPEARPAPAATTVAAPPAAEEPAAEEPTVQRRRMRTAAPSDELPSCVASARDPWQCYR